MTYDAWNPGQAPQGPGSGSPAPDDPTTEMTISAQGHGLDSQSSASQSSAFLPPPGVESPPPSLELLPPPSLELSPPPSLELLPPPSGIGHGETLPPSVPSPGWSALGATPSGPPVLPSSAQGSGQFLPPVAPPLTLQTPEPTKPPNPRWGWRAVASFVAGGLIAAAGFGVAQLGDSSGPAIIETAATTIPATTSPPIRSGAPGPTVPLDGAEPAEFVAQKLGPSVVQIDTDFGVGSGVIFGDGHILTNNHVVVGATSIRVKLADGRSFPGTLLGRDVNTDVAVVSVGPGLGLPIAELATGEKARVGQIAIAIGSPFDLQQSVTLGIVSAVDRPIQNSETSVVAMIQTDAPINPGNSGGALADRQGRVLGINTSIQTDGLTAANVGVGFAVPIDTAIRVADLLVAGQPIQPGFLGVRGQLPPSGDAGVDLIEVTPGSAAEDAGLLVGDRVLTLNEAPVTGFPELAGLVLANQAGDVVRLEILRDGELLELDVTLGLRDE